MGSFLQTLKDPKVRAVFDKRPEPTRRLIAGMAWEHEVKSRLPQGMQQHELKNAKETFVDRFIGSQSRGPIEQTETPTAGAFAGSLGQATAPAFEGAFDAMATGSELLRKRWGYKEQRSPFRNVSEAAKDVGKEFTEAHPDIAGAQRLLPQMLAAGRVASIAGPVAGALAGPKTQLAAEAFTGGVSQIPFAEKTEDIPSQFAVGAVAGPIFTRGIIPGIQKLFGGTFESAKAVLNKVRGSSVKGESLADLERRAILESIGLNEAGKSVSEIISKLPANKQTEFNKLQSAAGQSKVAEVVTSEKSARAAQAIEKKALIEEAKARGRLDGFQAKYGTPTPEQAERLRKGGPEVASVYREVEAIQEATNKARTSLAAIRLRKARADSKGQLATDQIKAIIDDVNKMTLDQINPELAASRVKPLATTTTPKVEKPIGEVPGPAPQKLVEAQRNEELITPKLVEERPDVVAAVEAVKTLSQPAAPSVAPSPDYVIKVLDEPFTLLTDVEARSGSGAKLALDRLIEQSKKEILSMKASGASIETMKRVAGKYTRLNKFLSQEGMDEWLSREGVEPLNMVGKQGRPTKAEASSMTSAQRADATAKREASALEQKRKEIAIGSGGSGTGEIAERKAAQRANQTKQDNEAIFRDLYKREPTESEVIRLDTTHNPATAVDTDLQVEFENSHPELFE